MEKIKTAKHHNYLAKMVVINDLERLPWLVDNDFEMAESVAIQNYTKKKSNVEKVDCD